MPISDRDKEQLKRYAPSPPPYPVSDDAYRTHLGNGITVDDLRDWGMAEERISLITGIDTAIAGCMDADAVNFNPLATINDGSCEYTGCTNPEAINYDPRATIDDGSCDIPNEDPLPPTEAKPTPERDIIEESTLRELVAKVVADEIPVSSVKTELGLEDHDWDKIARHYNENRIPEWDGIPTLPAKKTDLWVLGIPGSGKSAMLSAVLGRLNEKGYLLGASYQTHSEGFTYRTYLENAYTLDVSPEATQVEGFNFVPMDLLVDMRKKKYQPGNLIEMAGDKVRSILTKRNTNDPSSLVALDWLECKNPKIITIVLDITNTDLNQASDLNMVFQMLLNRGVLKKTQKVILLVTKVDQLDSFTPDCNPNLQAEVLEEVQRKFGTLITTIKTFCTTPLEVLPFSVGEDFVKEKYIRGDRHNLFVDEYIKLLRDAMQVCKLPKN